MQVSGTHSDAATSEDFVQSFARGLRVIRAFDADYPALTLSEVARRAEVTPAAARRLLRTLETLGYVRSDGRSFSLTPKVLELGYSYLSALSLPDLMRPHLEQLSHTVGESVSAAVLSGADIVYVARVPTRRIMSVNITLGTRFPAYATSMGRVLLAQLPESQLKAALAEAPLQPITSHTLTEATALTDEIARVREQGWAIVDGELDPGLRSLAVPVRQKNGEIAAALNVSSNSGGASLVQFRERVLPLALETARAVEDDLRLL